MEIEITLPGVSAVPVALGARETIELSGPMVVDRSDPGDVDGDGLADIQTEIISMELTGQGSMGPITVSLNSDTPSLGEVEQQERGQDTPANSFFDIYLTVLIEELGLTGFNEEPIRMEAELIEFPPGFLDQYEGALALPTPLLSVDSKEEFALILDALHVPNPAPPTPGATGAPTPTPAATAAPTPTPEPAEDGGPPDVSGTYSDCTVAVQQDRAGHAGPIGMPGMLNLEVSQPDSIVVIDGPPPWVSVSGALLPDGGFSARGMGEVAGFPDVQIQFDGLFQDHSFGGTATYGAEGGLPQGEPIIYQVDCPPL